MRTLKRTTILENADFQTREGEDGKLVISGYFARFDDEYELSEGYAERIDPHAFDRDVKEDKTDVLFLYNHDRAIVLARTGNGTGSLSVDSTGLYGELEINREDSQAMDIYARVKRKDVFQCSFGFFIRDEKPIYRDGKTIFFVKDLSLREVSIVAFPAYKKTSVSARSDCESAASVRRALLKRIKPLE